MKTVPDIFVNPIVKTASSQLLFLICPLLFLHACIASEEVNYLTQIRPILEERCFACHGALKQEASLRVDSVLHLIEGEVVDRANPEESELLLRILDPSEESRMPPEGKALTPEQVELIRNWIHQGAKAPKNDIAEQAPEEHWAFQPPKKSKSIPGTSTDSPNPIDVLLEKVRTRDRTTATQLDAPKGLLLRRLYIDLIGVPPTPEQLARFERDDSPDAYEKQVEELLKLPQHGERWGRHWMDVWRYTDWYGLGDQLRNSQRHIWRWRDWIIESINSDVGYDEMIRQMLAADELYPTDRKKLRATGFLARNYYLFNRTTWLDSTIEHTGKAFLGLTMNCAKCHDHKYDPISQVDYYRFRAVFEPHQVRLDPVQGTTDLLQDGLPRVFDAHPEAKTYLHLRGDEKSPDKSNEIKAGVPRFFKFASFQPGKVELPYQAFRPSLQPFVLKDHLASIDQKIAEQESKLKKLHKTEASLVAENSKGVTRIFYEKLNLKQADPKGFFIDESFENLDTDRWKIIKGNWSVEKGKLTQTETGSQSRIIQSQASVPRDFLIEAELSVHGGQVWKSFGIRFDVGGTHEKTVYLSAHQDSKVQFSYAVDGKTTYPSKGLAKVPIKVGQTYRLRIGVRNDLINVSIDGKHLFAYRIPIARKPGKLQLMSFDSVARFDNVRAIELSPEVVLSSPESGFQSLAEIQRQIKRANSQMEIARLRRKAIQSGHAAEVSELNNDPESTQKIRKASAVQIALDRAIKVSERLELDFKLTDAKESNRKSLLQSIKKLSAEIDALEQKQSEKAAKRYYRLKASLKSLEGPDEKTESRNKPYPEFSTGRRTALANWIVDRRNPLTARVAVNQVWLRHFGKPLVESVTDLGRRSRPPLHQELLDWLAVDLMEHNWKLKRLHKLIVTSKAYRMASRDPQIKVSGENSHYQLRAPIRMESQVIRDSLLHLAGQLEERLGGPPMDPDTQASSSRRSLYFRQSRDDKHPFVSMFDDADILRCYRRQESIIPQQALTLSNSRLAYSAAEKVAAACSQTNGKDRDFIFAVFRHLLCRSPDSTEMTSCLEALTQLRQLAGKDADSEKRCRAIVVLGVINSNDFVTVR